MNKGFVIAASGTYGPCPTSVTVVARSNMMRTEELITGGMIDAAFLHVPHLSNIRIDEAMT